MTEYMAHNEYARIKEIITKYHLQPTTQRNLPLLTLSIITMGYTIHLKRRLGYSYEALVFIGRENWFHSMMGEEILNNKTRAYLKKKRGIDALLASLITEFKKARKGILLVKKIQDKKQAILEILENYLRYMAVISVYNCFWRYIGNREHDQFISDRIIQRISHERVLVAKFYPKIEEIIRAVVIAIGKSSGFDGTLLQYLSYLEFGGCLRKGISEEKIKELKKRKERYFYAFVEKSGKELITTDKAVISRLQREFYDVNEKITELRGFPAYTGFVVGRVFNMTTSQGRPSGGYILVAPSTHPDDIGLIKDAAAIVTDEGGILSHASVISRELKIPCVVGTKVATKVLKDGDLVEVDARTGRVTKQMHPRTPAGRLRSI